MTELSDLRSSIEPVVWPAILRGQAAELLALQHQFDRSGPPWMA